MTSARQDDERHRVVSGQGMIACTHESMSKSMNSMTFSCALSAVVTQPLGKGIAGRSLPAEPALT